jgi:hypothetical protein
MDNKNQSDLTRRLWNLGSAFRWTAKEIEEGRISPGSGEAIHYDGNPVCAFGWALHTAAKKNNKDLKWLQDASKDEEGLTDNGETAINYLNDEMSVLPKELLRRLRTVSDRVASVNDPIFGGDNVTTEKRKKVAAALRVVAKTCDHLMKESYKYDLLKKRAEEKERKRIAKEKEIEEGKKLLKALTTAPRREVMRKEFVKDREEMKQATEEVRELAELMRS